MHWALLLSLGVHAAALTVHVVDPEGFNRVFQDTPLEVVLVNAKAGACSENCSFCAQSSFHQTGSPKYGARVYRVGPALLVKQAVLRGTPPEYVVDEDRTRHVPHPASPLPT